MIEEGALLGETPKGQGHCLISGSFAIADTQLDHRKAQRRLIWSRADYSSLSHHIANYNWQAMFHGTSANANYGTLVQIYKKAVDIYISLTTKPFSSKN
jgi:hypothetical protein